MSDGKMKVRKLLLRSSPMLNIDFKRAMCSHRRLLLQLTASFVVYPDLKKKKTKCLSWVGGGEGVGEGNCWKTVLHPGNYCQRCLDCVVTYVDACFPFYRDDSCNKILRCSFPSLQPYPTLFKNEATALH